MIVLDTNVLSETLQPSPDATVMTWLAAQPGATLFTTSVNKAEILYSLYRLRKDPAKTRCQMRSGQSSVKILPTGC